MYNIVIIGVGGQGTLLASKILGYIGNVNNYDVRVSEVHGMSQRGGSVVTYVRLSNDSPIYATLVEQKQADVVLAFEKLEALRAIPYLKEEGTMIVNEQQILPMPVIIGNTSYPEGILERIRSEVKETIALDATSMAEKAGSFKAANVVLLGVLAKKLPFKMEDWMEAIEACVKPQFIELNKKAFKMGYEL